MTEIVGFAVDVTYIDEDGQPGIAKMTPIVHEFGVGKYLDEANVFTYDLASSTKEDDLVSWWNALS